MKKFTELLDNFLKNLLVFLMGFMTLVVTWQVVTRYVLNSPSSYTEELSTYLLIWISLLGTAYALRLRAHLGIDVLTKKLQGKARQISNLVIYLAVIVFAAAVMVYGGLHLVYVTLHLNQLSAAFRIPVGYVYLVLPLSGLLIIYYSIFLLLHPEEEVPETDFKRRAAAD
jgi:TRAP-type C4-dicarboxylate transport system permease small subunit